MKKISHHFFLIALSLFAFYQTAFAEDNTTFININSSQQQVTFDSNRHGEFKLPADSERKSVTLSVPTSSSDHIMLPWCDNKIIDASHSANCQASAEAMTLTFIKQPEDKPIVKSNDVTTGTMILVITAVMVAMGADPCYTVPVGIFLAILV